MSGFLAAVAVLLATAAVLAPLPRVDSRSYARFRVGSVWTWCPAEACWTPHSVDAGGRRCLSCKTTTTSTEELPRG